MPPFLQADEATISSITYYLQNELPQQASILIEEKIRVNPRDPLLLFWHACSIGSSGLEEQAIELLQRLQRHRTHISYSIKNAISHFQSSRGKSSSALGVGSGTPFTSQFDSIDEAVLCVAFNLFVKKDSMEALRILDGFVTTKLSSNESLLCGFSVPALYANATIDSIKNDLLQDVIKYSENSLSCLFTLATEFDTKGDVEKSLTYLNRTISRDNSFVPAYLEKTKALISLGKLELARENCQKTIAACGNNNYEALLLHLLTEILINGICTQTLAQINELSSRFLKMKPPNPRYYYEFAVLFSRLSDQSTDVLQITSGMLKRACELSSEHEKYRVEYINHTRFLGKYDEAVEQYERGLENESENQIDLIKGLLLSLIARGSHKEAKNRLDFFSVTHEELSSFPEMNLIRELLSICHSDDVGANISIIRQFIETSNSSKVDTNESLVKKLIGIDPQFLFEVAKELITIKSSWSLAALDFGSKVVELGLEILRKIMLVYRGSLRTSLTLAKAFIDGHRYESALKVLVDSKISHAQSSLVYLLCAKASVDSGDYSDAKSNLEQAMSLDFSISKHLHYKYCESLILIDEGRVEMAKEILKDCLRGGRKSDSVTEDCDTLHCYFMLASIFMKSKDIKDAKDILIAAYDAFKGSALEIDALIQLSRFLVNNGDIQEGVKILGSVKKPPMMVKAQIELADVFLNNIGNRKEYIKCFQRILKKSKTTNNILLLCDAYMKTNSPSKAVEVLRTVNAEDPKNEKITICLGKALRMMGDPDGVLECYEDDIRNYPWHQSIRVELIKIYLDLNFHEKAASLLIRSINDFDNIGVATSENFATKFSLLLMLAEVHEASNHIDGMREVILNAKEMICNKAVCCESMFEEVSDNRKKLSELFCRVANYCEGIEDFLGAEEMMKDALDIQCDDETILLRLGKVYLSQSKFEHCRNITSKLASSSEGALQLHGDLLIAQSHLDDACSVYMKLLALNPVNYIVLGTCLSLLHRLGRTDEMQQLIFKAESLDNDSSSPGLLFSKGNMFLYQNKFLDSFHFFNLVRKHKIWGPKAISRMIHILLHYQELSQLSCFENTASTQERNYMITARMLVSELKEIETNNKYFYNIQGYVHFCSGELDPAVNVFSEVLALDKEYVPSLLGLAKTLFPTSSSKARNILKKIAQLPHRDDYHREFETCYLMLAEQYIAKDKVDHALELLNAVNARNKSCSKSWSIIGDLDQSKDSFLDAADSYEKAWKISRETDYVSGYKTALNYYKAKKTVKSIEVCEEVLSHGVQFKEVKELMSHHCVQSIRP